MNIHTIILAGGKGTRMLSQKAKVLQALGGRTMLNHVLTTANKISNKISVVMGFDKEGVEEEIKKIGINANTYLQKEQIGTADAVKTTLKDIDKNEKILILYGDVPGHLHTVLGFFHFYLCLLVLFLRHQLCQSVLFEDRYLH